MNLRARVTALERKLAEVDLSVPCARCGFSGSNSTRVVILQEGQVLGTCPDCGSRLGSEGQPLGGADGSPMKLIVITGPSGQSRNTA